MLMKRPEHKRFDYIPRYYDPEKDKSQKLKDRIEIARKSYLYKKKNNRLIIYFLIIILIIYLAIKFGLL
ncbi:MAG: hypothetical protein WHV63_08500 [Ignavibacteria bacterium]|jgi:hypothetical protein